MTSTAPRGRALLLPLVLAVALVAVLAVGAYVVTSGRGVRLPPTGPASPGASGGPQDDIARCRPSADNPGPLLDLGVQPATGDPAAPLLPPERVRRLVGLAARAGAGVISTAASWSAIQPTRDGGFDFSGVDEVARAARAAGLTLRIQLTGSPAWAFAPPGATVAPGETADTRWRAPRTPAQLELWQAFVSATVRHLSADLSYVEVWQEPNNPDFFTPRPDPAAYARLLRATYPVVHEAAPDAEVISGGLAGNDLGFAERLYRSLDAQGASGADGAFDLLGVHPFSGDHAPDDDDPALRYRRTGGLYDERFSGYAALHQVAVEAGDTDNRLYLGEFGYSTRAHGAVAAVTDAQRAAYAPVALDVATCTPYVVALSWYYLHPTPWNAAAWTLLDRADRPNATFLALQDWSEQRARQSGTDSVGGHK